MTQKEIMDAKKKAKECLDIFDIKVPMVKMHILFFHIDTDGFFINFIDVRTHDYFTCECKNNEYDSIINVKMMSVCTFFHESKGGEIID